MMIDFLCPQGHRIHCDSSRAGQAAKCPKCGAKFRIPKVEAVPPTAEAAPQDAAVPPPDAPAQVEAGCATSTEQMEFLCPNNHLLHGPLSLQGEPGQCPTCSSRFRIPLLDEPEAEEAGGGEPPALPGLEGSLALDEGSSANGGSVTRASALGQPEQTAAMVFTQLWSEKRRGSEVELVCGDGRKVRPVGFAPSLSRGAQGVFAVKEEDQSYTLLVLRWADIQEVVIRRLKKLPDEIIE